MKILFWSETFWPGIGGIEVLATRFLLALRQRGHQLVIVTSFGERGAAVPELYEGMPIYRFPFEAALADRDPVEMIRARQRLAALKREYKPDLIHAFHLGRSCLFHLQTAKVQPAPVVATLHLTFPDRFLGPEEVVGSMLRGADWVTACSASVLRETQAVVPAIVPYSSAIPNSLDLPELLPGPLLYDAPRLLCLGRLVSQKGFDLALAAFAGLIDRFPALQLTIAGDGIARGALERQARDLGVDHLVEFAGWIQPENVPALINRSTMVLMPSRKEGLPLVAIQAAQMARPVVAARVDGLGEIVIHGETGLLVEKEDGPGLAEAIKFLLTNRAAAEAMGVAARRRAQEVFNWEAHVDAYESLYSGLVSPS